MKNSKKDERKKNLQAAVELNESSLENVSGGVTGRERFSYTYELEDGSKGYTYDRYEAIKYDKDTIRTRLSGYGTFYRAQGGALDGEVHFD